jgi:hypothetical protein
MLALRYPWIDTKPRHLLKSAKRVFDVCRAYHPSTEMSPRLHYILQMARQNSAKDSRDKVYAFLSHPSAKNDFNDRSDPGRQRLSQDEEVETRSSEDIRLRNLAVILSPDASEMRTTSVRYIERKDPTPVGPDHDVITAYRILNDRENQITNQRRLWRGITLITPDYNKSVVCVYREVALASIERTDSLEILSYVQQHELLASIGPDFPSWIPRWDLNMGV